MAAPVVASHSTDVAFFDGGPVIALPSGTVAGDLLVAGIYSNAAITPPSGWTLIRTVGSGHTGSLHVYYKVVGNSEPGSYTFSTSDEASGGIARITGAHATYPIRQSATAASTNSPSVSTTVDDCLILRAVGGARQDSLNFVTPAGCAQVWNFGGGANFQSTEQALFTQSQATAGATGTADVGSQGHNWAGITVAIAPATDPHAIGTQVYPFAPLVNPDQADVALLDQLESAWELNEASGTRVDSHGSNDLTDNNTVGSGTGLVYGTAADFEADNSEYLSVPNNASLQGGDFDRTIELWCKFESTGGVALIGQDDSPGSANRSFVLFSGVFTGGFDFAVVQGTTNTFDVVSSAPVSVGVWYQVLVWYDSKAGRIGIRVNNGTPSTTPHSNGFSPSTADWQIGAARGISFFDGLIGPVRVWNRLLSDRERAALYNDGAGLPYSSFTGQVDVLSGLKSAWELNETAGVRVDSHGDNDLTDNNTVMSGTGLVYAAAADFEASNSEFLSIADNADLSTGDVSWTYETWVKLESNGFFCLAGKGNGITDAASEWLLYYTGSQVRLQVYFGSSNVGATSSFGALSVGVWYQVIAWHDAENEQIGVEVNASATGVTAHSGGLNDTTHDFRIGIWGSGIPFDGLIGPSRFWKGRVLPASVRMWLYNDGSARPYSSFVPGRVPGTQVRPFAAWVEPAIESGGLSAAVGTGTEADSALALGRTKLQSVGLATETDSALALSSGVSGPTGRADETDTATGLSTRKVRPTGTSTETDGSLALARQKLKVAGLAGETDTALALGRVKLKSVGLSVETDTALGLAAGNNRPVGLSGETDAGLGLGSLKRKSVGFSTTTNTATALVGVKVRQAGRSTEADESLILASGNSRPVGRADETDTPVGLSRRKSKGVNVGSETNTAVRLVQVKSRLVGLVVETESAFRNLSVKHRQAGRSNESDVAITLAGSAGTISLVCVTTPTVSPYVQCGQTSVIPIVSCGQTIVEDC